jgi:hypothetical protein
MTATGTNNAFFDPLGLASPSRSNLVAREPLQRFHASWGNAAARLTTLACASIPKMNLTPRPSHRSNSPVNVKSVSPPENARHAAGERNSPSDHNGWVKRILLIGFHPLQGKWCKELDVDQMRRHLDQETDLEADAPEVVLDQREEHMALSDKRAGHGDEKVEPSQSEARQ